jgi:uncharacterized protein DUF4234
MEGATVSETAGNDAGSEAPAEETPAAPAEAPAPETTSGVNTGPFGKERGVGFVIVLTIVTLGIYSIYWYYVTYADLKRHREEGVNGIVGLLLVLVIYGYFMLPQYVGRMYRAEGNDNPPVSGLTGLWGFVPYVGGFIYLAKVQGALNNYWRAKGAGSVASAPVQSF